MTNKHKPILCLDFDGVIHDYREGWKDGSIYGHVTEGFWPWVLEAQKHFRLYIHSSRFADRTSDLHSINCVQDWLRDEWTRFLETDRTPISMTMPIFVCAPLKPPAFLTIDDRAITFLGDWSHLEPAELLHLKPWNQR